MEGRHPHLELVVPYASPVQAAAIAAALERFSRDTAVPVSAEPEKADRWFQTAILEGVSRENPLLSDWGDTQV